MSAKIKKPKPVCAGNVDVGAYLDNMVSLKDIRAMLKKSGLKTKDAYLKIEFDYAGCYYEGDSPNISVKVYGLK